MSVIVIIAFWIAVGTAWASSGYLYYCGMGKKNINPDVMIRLIVVSIFCMAVACIGNALIQVNTVNLKWR